MYMAFAVPCALILCLVAVLHVPAADGQWALYKSGRSLDVSLLYIDPCYQEANDSVQHLNTSLWAVTTNYTYCRNGDATTSKQALQIKTKVLSNGSLTFVVRDERNIQSWKLPLKLPEYFTTFTTAYYTLCNTMLPDDTVKDYVAYIDTFTGSQDPVDYSIEVTAVDQFILNTTGNSVFISADSPQMAYYEFPENVSSVNVIANSSNDNLCAMVSVQNATCPVNNLLSNIKNKGIMYQTMNTLSSIRVDRNRLSQNGFFVVVILLPPSYCNDSKSINNADVNFHDISMEITLKIEENSPSSSYIWPIFFPIVVFVPLGVIALLFIHALPCCDKFIFHPFGKLCHRSDDAIEEEEEHLTGSHTASRTTYASLSTQAPTRDKLIIEITEHKARLSDIMNTAIPTPNLKSEYNGYFWNIITISIFYGLPAFQLVLTKQLILNFSGDQDYCYYNFLCAKQHDTFNAFNNSWSNIGYVILGLFFLLIVIIKHLKVVFCNKPDEENLRGLPQIFGVYYAIGIALITEGFMSAFYHICPSSYNFQFDTAFMFIISGLMIIRIIQCRHPNLYSNAFIAILCLAVVILLTFVGIYEETKDEASQYGVKLSLFVIFLIAMVVFGITYYFYIGCIINKDLYKKTWQYFKKDCIPFTWKSVKPRHMVRFIRILSFLIINFIAGLTFILMREGMATIVLALFIINLLWLLLLYISFKLFWNEPLTVKPIIMLVLMGVCWFGAFWYYTHSVTQWQFTPAFSRDKNRECLILEFYDNHDVWHFLSAVAMFFSFLFLLVLDDGLVNVKRNKIHVF